LMSIALGWHYAADGLVGAVGALSCYLASLIWCRGMEPARKVILVPSDPA
jgi:hypothetical protein